MGPLFGYQTRATQGVPHASGWLAAARSGTNSSSLFPSTLIPVSILFCLVPYPFFRLEGLEFAWATLARQRYPSQWCTHSLSSKSVVSLEDWTDVHFLDSRRCIEYLPLDWLVPL